MQIIHLNQNNFRLYPQVWMVQNDTGRTLKMILDDTTLAGTETGSVAIHRSDGSYYTISATRVSGENAFTADMTQALTQPGLTKCQLKVTASTLVVSTYTFAIHVEESTDGISEEQLGYSVQQLAQDAEDIRAGGMSLALRTALLQIAEKVAYIDDQGATYYQDLYDALQPQVTLVSISAVYTQGGTVYTTDSLDSLKNDLVVTAHYNDSSSETVPSASYTLSGSLTVGTSTITVAYDGKTTTFTVTVSAEQTLFKLSEGDFVVAAGAMGMNATYGIITNLNANSLSNRKKLYTSEGVRPYWQTTNDTTFTVTDPPEYPIRVPSDATSVTYSVTPNTQFMGISLWSYDSVADNYTRIADPGWKQGGSTHTFTANPNQYLTCSFKYNSSGSGYPTAPTEVVFQFS